MRSLQRDFFSCDNGILAKQQYDTRSVRNSVTERKKEEKEKEKIQTCRRQATFLFVATFETFATSALNITANISRGIFRNRERTRIDYVSAQPGVCSPFRN
jgi:hypothetical protein